MMPFSCAASSASAIWPASARAVHDRNWPASDLFGQRLAINQLHHQSAVTPLTLFDAVDGRYMWDD